MSKAKLEAKVKKLQEQKAELKAYAKKLKRDNKDLQALLKQALKNPAKFVPLPMKRTPPEHWSWTPLTYGGARSVKNKRAS